MTSSNPIAPAPGLDVSVVIPVCNEQENVLPLAREIHAALDGRYRYETIFVDDGSTDGTAEAVRAARGDGMPEIRLIRHSVRSGQSAAVATGVREARAPWIATLDGDGQNDPADIPKLLDAARTARIPAAAAGHGQSHDAPLVYLPVAIAEPGKRFEVEIRGRREPAVVVPTPFYKRSR